MGRAGHARTHPCEHSRPTVRTYNQSLSSRPHSRDLVCTITIPIFTRDCCVRANYYFYFSIFSEKNENFFFTKVVSRFLVFFSPKSAGLNTSVVVSVYDRLQGRGKIPFSNDVIRQVCTCLTFDRGYSPPFL